MNELLNKLYDLWYAKNGHRYPNQTKEELRNDPPTEPDDPDHHWLISLMTMTEQAEPAESTKPKFSVPPLFAEGVDCDIWANETLGLIFEAADVYYDEDTHKYIGYRNSLLEIYQGISEDRIDE